MDVLRQVRKTIARYRLFARGDLVIVGVSGGPDSLALLHCLCALREELQISLQVAHLNHQLRGDESDADAQSVARVAREWQLPAVIRSRDVRALARERRLSLEEAARSARYEFLAQEAREADAACVAVAHHADDQAETILMHFLRGAGMAGLRGMEYRGLLPGDSVGLRLVRPLLDVTRPDIEAYCREHGIEPRFDRSNEDMSFFRNRLRQEVLPYLETLNPNLRQVLGRTARALADDYAYLQEQVRSAYAGVAREEEGAIFLSRLAWRALPVSLQRGTLRRAVQRLRGDVRNVDWTHVEDARRIAAEKSAGAAYTLPKGLFLVVGYEEIAIGEAARVRGSMALRDWPRLEAETLALPVPGVVALPHSPWLVEAAVTDKLAPAAGRWTASFDLDRCGGELLLRRRRSGDRFQPMGLHGHSKLVAEFMIDARVPRAVRDALPLLVSGDRILWICGLRADARAVAGPDTHHVLQVTFRKEETH